MSIRPANQFPGGGTPPAPPPPPALAWQPLRLSERIVAEDKVVAGIVDTISDASGVWTVKVDSGAEASSISAQTVYSFPMPAGFVGDGRDLIALRCDGITDVAFAAATSGARAAFSMGAGIITTPGSAYASANDETFAFGHFRFTDLERFAYQPQWNTFGDGQQLIGAGPSLARHRVLIGFSPLGAGFAFAPVRGWIANNDTGGNFVTRMAAGFPTPRPSNTSATPVDPTRARIVLAFGRRSTIAAGSHNTLTLKPEACLIRLPL